MSASAPDSSRLTGEVYTSASSIFQTVCNFPSTYTAAASLSATIACSDSGKKKGGKPPTRPQTPNPRSQEVLWTM